MIDLSAHLEALLEMASRTEPGPERDRAMQAVLDDASAEAHAEDPQGHEHAPAGTSKGGQFVKKGGGGEGGGKEKKEGKPTAKKPPAEVEKPAAQEYNPAEDDPAAGRPSKPEERHQGAAPKPLPWRAPPPKKGKKGEGMKARPTGNQSQTRVGDMVEDAVGKLGFRNILPPGQRSHKPGEVAEKGSTIDREYDHSGKLYEVKACQTTSTEYRLKAKAKEKEAKLKFAEIHKGEAYTMVPVYDPESGEIHVYVGKEPGLIGAEVSEAKFNYLGTIKP